MRKIIIVALISFLLIGCKGASKPTNPIDNQPKKMPDLIGMNIYQNIQSLKDLDVEFEIIYSTDYRLENGAILSTIPETNQSLDNVKKITLCINKTEDADTKSQLSSLLNLSASKYSQKDALRFYETHMELSQDSMLTRSILSTNFGIKLFGPSLFPLLLMVEKPIAYDKKIINYLTDNDKKKYSKAIKDCEIGVQLYEINEIQNSYDSIWGKNRIDIRKWDVYNYDWTKVTENDYLIMFPPTGFGYEEGYECILTKLDDVKELDGGIFVVSVYVINIDDSYVVETSDFYSYYFLITDYSNNKTFTFAYDPDDQFDIYDADYDECLDHMGLKGKIGVVEFELYPTADGLRLWGVRDNNLNDKTRPTEFVYEKAQVNASGGLRLREGPGTNYKSKLTIKNKQPVVIRGRLPENADWVFIDYYGNYGWVSTKYLKITNP